MAAATAAAAKRILIVEDNADLRGMFRTALSFAGYIVLEAADGWSALSKLAEESPDLVVLDLVLPTVSGHVVLAELTGGARTKRVPVIVVTASPEPLNHRCVLRKPVTPERLLETVRTYLGMG